MSFTITKASGEKAPFDIKKFSRSLARAGADEDLIAQLVQEIQTLPQLTSTRDIYHFALNKLKEANSIAATRYNLKRALFLLGPSGFPFEKYVARLLDYQGYQTETDRTMQGMCCTHELDVIAHKGETHMMVECKFHNRHGITTDIQVALYVKARFDDVSHFGQTNQSLPFHFNAVMLATNTRFTNEAIQYAQCMKMQLLGWGYPEKNNLESLIDHSGLYPITILTHLTMPQKQELINHGVVLCQEVNEKNLGHLRLNDEQMQKVLQEAGALCRSR